LFLEFLSAGVPIANPITVDSDIDSTEAAPPQPTVRAVQGNEAKIFLAQWETSGPTVAFSKPAQNKIHGIHLIKFNIDIFELSYVF
jgi:hypothetical protein